MRAITLAVSLLLTSAIFFPAAAEEPTAPKSVADCDQENFTESVASFGVVSFRPGSEPYLIVATDPCIDSDISKCSHTPVDTMHRWFAGKRIASWLCISDARSFGWTLADGVTVSAEPITHYDDWLGKWERDVGGADLEIRKATSGKLAVVGTAEWMAGPDAVPHTGDIDDSGRADGVRLVLGDPKCLGAAWDDDECVDCVARLVALNGRIFVNDNYHCGGMNVRFDGIYDRVKPNRK